MRKIGKYTLVGPSAEHDWAPENIVLDTNVLIHLRDFYFGNRRVPDELRELLLEFPYLQRKRFVEINYGWAATEASWVPGVGSDPVRRRRLIYAAEQMLWWDHEQIISAFARRHPPAARDNKWGKVPLTNAADQLDPRFMLVTHYGGVLFLLALEKQRALRKSKGPLWAVEQFVTWMTDVLGIRSSYVINLACMLLAGDGETQKAVRKILKFKDTATPDEMATRAWNVAWDIVMTSMGEGVSFGLLPGARKLSTVLVTYDVDPTLLRMGTEMRTIIDTGERIMPFSLVSASLKVSHSDLQKIIEIDMLEAWKRSNRDPAALMAQATAAVQALEAELEVPVPYFGKPGQRLY